MSKSKIITNGYVFFSKCYLSQDYQSTFYVKDFFFQEYSFSCVETGLFTQTYNCVEQYMMAKKALLFGDVDSHKNILAAQTAKEQKALGREVKGFQQGIWDNVKYDIAYKGNFAKFLANTELREQLLEDYEDGRSFVQCSKKDDIWGIGLGLENSDIYDEDSWKGINLMGEVLTHVAEDLSRYD